MFALQRDKADRVAAAATSAREMSF